MIEIVGSSGMYAVIGIVIVAVASLFGLVVFASKEEKFEDVVEAQKRVQEALLQSLNTTTSKPSKSKKKWAKIKSQKSAKAGEKKVLQDEPEAEILQDNVSEASAEVVVPSTEIQIKKTKKKRTGSDKKTGKDVVDHKKREPPPQILEELIEQAEFQLECEAQPAMELEQKADKQRKEQADKDIVSEVIAEIKETTQQSQPPPAGKEQEKPIEVEHQKKTKAKKTKPQVTQTEDKKAADKLAKDLEKSQFTASDVQRLIDILLDKQNELQQWQMPNKKGDIVEDLGKKCHNLEEQLKEEKKTCLTAAHENKELRLEIQHERSQLKRIQTQANQKITQQGGEIQALQKRMEMTQETHLREMQNAQSQLQQLKEVIDKSAPIDMQRLKEENVLLQNASMRTQQLSEEKNSLVAEYSQLQQTSKNLRAELDSSIMQIQKHKQQVQLYEDQNNAHENEIQKLRIAKTETENLWSGRVSKFKEQAAFYDAENKKLMQQLQLAQQELENSKLVKEGLQTKSADSAILEQNLSESLKEIENLAASLMKSENKLKQYQEVELQNSELLKKLADEKKELQDKIEQEKDEIVIVEKPNGIHSDDQVSHEQHVQIITEKDKVISELKEDVKSTKEELERLANVMHQEKHEKDDAVKQLNDAKHHLEDQVAHLQKDMAEEKAEKKKLEEAIEHSKTKNNDLREKNWKAMDALSTTEANAKKTVKDTEEAVFKVLKKIRPSIKLERNQPLQIVLQEYQETFLRNEEETKQSEKSSEELECVKKELDELKESNNALKKDLDGLKKEKENVSMQLKTATENSSSSVENLKSLSEDNKKANLQIEHYKKVLEETEGMLKKLQTGIESTVTSHEKKLNEKDQELKQLKDKTFKLEETLKNNDDKTQLELDLKKTQEELDLEKKAKSEIELELEEAKKKVTGLEEHLEISQSEDNLAQSQESLNSSHGSASPKKKKGFKHAFSKAFHKKSEGVDDAKHQLSAVQEQLSKIEAEKSELAKKLSSVSDAALAKDEEINKIKTSKDSLNRELAKLKEKLDVVEQVGKDSGKSDKEKNKIIAKLTLENAELREDLRDERDRVVVDVESPEAEQLKSDLSSLKQQYEQEKDSSSKLNSSLHELEEQLKNQKSELEKKEAELAQMEQKYKEAADQSVVNEQKVKELELAGLTKSERIEMEIDEAINQSGNSPTSPQRTVGAPLLEQLEEVKSNLSEKETQLESEMLANKQLRAQLAALTTHASHGTSV